MEDVGVAGLGMVRRLRDKDDGVGRQPSERLARRLLAKVEGGHAIRGDMAGLDADEIADAGDLLGGVGEKGGGVLVQPAHDGPGASDDGLELDGLEHGLGHGDQMVPESTWMAWPVIEAAPSPRRKATVSATEPSSVGRLSEVRA